jgi:uncharacterized protein
MHFEWDATKNARNIRKHGIDFVDATRVFKDPFAVIVEDPHPREERWKITGKMVPHIIVVCFLEVDEDTMRLISARLAEPHESRAYYAEHP